MECLDCRMRDIFSTIVRVQLICKIGDHSSLKLSNKTKNLSARTQINWITTPSQIDWKPFKNKKEINPSTPNNFQASMKSPL